MADLLILAPSDWASTLQSFVRYKNDISMPTKLLTVEEIAARFNGKDLPEKIKQAIEAHRRLHGTKYVMLVGDADKFPVRYVRAINTEWGTKWYPSDLYYADLYNSNGQFDRWDSDHDGIFGEIDFAGGGLSGTNLDQINMVPDVAVGRIPASTEGELQTYLKKVMSYEFAASQSYWFNYDSGWFKRALFIVDGGSSPFGDESLSDQYAGHLEDSGISITRRYQDEHPWNNLSHQERVNEVNTQLNNGVGFVHLFGHANTTGFAGWYSTNDMNDLKNDNRLSVVFAIGCYPARFHFDLDNYQTVNNGDWTGGAPKPNRPEPAAIQPSRHDRDSMAEGFLVKRSGGAIAFIGAVSKFEHGGKSLAEYFFEAYKTMSKPPVLGAMWRDALSRFARTDALQGMGGYYAFIHIHKVMLFGDPSLRVGGIQPPITAIGAGELSSEILNAAL